MRAVRIARSVGRPSRLKKPPGIFPAAYMRSSTSTVSGKKSAPSRGSIRPIAVARTIGSPGRTSTAPPACLASLPVSKLISWSPTVVETRVSRSVAIAIWSPPSLGRRWRFGSAPPLRGARTNFHPPRVLVLTPEAELLDQRAVGLDVLALEIVEQPAAPADELEQAAPRVVVLRVRAEMLGELVDPRRQQCDLHLRRPRVGVVLPVLADDVELGFLGEGHTPPCRMTPQSQRAAKEERVRPRLRSAGRVAAMPFSVGGRAANPFLATPQWRPGRACRHDRAARRLFGDARRDPGTREDDHHAQRAVSCPVRRPAPRVVAGRANDRIRALRAGPTRPACDDRDRRRAGRSDTHRRRPRPAAAAHAGRTDRAVRRDRMVA